MKAWELIKRLEEGGELAYTGGEGDYGQTTLRHFGQNGGYEVRVKSKINKSDLTDYVFFIATAPEDWQPIKPKEKTTYYLHFYKNSYGRPKCSHWTEQTLAEYSKEYDVACLLKTEIKEITEIEV